MVRTFDYRILGKVIERSTRQGVPGLRVETWDKDFVFSDLVGSAITRKDGSFELSFSSLHFREVIFDSQPDLFFRVFNGKTLLLDTVSSVLWNVKAGKTRVLLELDALPRPDHQPAAPSENATFYVRLVPEENLAAINQAIAMMVSRTPSKKDGAQLRLTKLRAPAALLEVLLNDARDTMLGDKGAAIRLLLNLNRTVAQLTPAPASGSPAPGPSVGFTVRPGVSAFIPELNLPFFDPCLFPARLMGQIAMGIFGLSRLFPQISRAAQNLYVQGIHQLSAQLAPLEALHAAAQRMMTGAPGGLDYFETVFESTATFGSLGGWLVQPVIGEVPGNQGELPFPLPEEFGVPGFFFPCNLEQWQATADASRCYRALVEGPHYQVDDIFNVDRGVSRRGCADDTIEIRGTDLGRTGEISFGTGNVAEIVAWSDTSIRFRVPSRGRYDGELGVCINPEIDSCIGFPYACRLSARDVDLSFEFVRPLELGIFAIEGPATVPVAGTPHTYRVEACSSVRIRAQVNYAERVVLSDSTGRVIYDTGDGEPRNFDASTLDSSVTTFDAPRESIRLILRATNLCGEISREISLHIYHQLRLSGASEVRDGESLELRIRCSCPALAPALPVSLTSSHPETLEVPAVVQIPEGSTETTVTVMTHSHCVEAHVTATAPGHDPATVDVLVYNTPSITSVAPMLIDACMARIIEIQGDCFDADGVNTVEFSAADGGSVYVREASSIRFTDTVNRLHQAVLEVNPGGLEPGAYRVRVTSHGLLSDLSDTSLVVRAIPPQINSISAHPSTVLPCIETALRLGWEVSGAQRVAIYAGDTLVASRNYTRACAVQTDSAVASVTLDEGTSVTLVATPFGGGDDVERTFPVSLETVLYGSTVSVRNLTNSDRDRWLPYTVTVWVVNGRTGIGRHERVAPGDTAEFELDDCVYYQVAAAVHEWIRCHNRDYRTSFDPNSIDIVSYPQFLAWSQIILGRNDTPLYSIRLEPGDPLLSERC